MFLLFRLKEIVFSVKVILGDTIMGVPFYVVIRAMYRSSRL